MEKISKYLESINGGDLIIYRGHANKNWELKPSIGRHYNRRWSDVIELEKRALSEFKKRSIPYLKHQPASDIEWLCLMQHHGCPTRLLDFTTNPLIALFFASDPTTREDGEVVVARYGRRHENVSNKDLFDRTHDFAYYPPHITERIIGQSGCFVYFSTPNNPLRGKQISTIRVPFDEKSEYRSELRDIGITNSTLFPGLDGICQDMNVELVFKISIEGVYL